jgi:DNA polymerase (family 10)
MDNYDISTLLGTYAKLAELHEENPFKVKALSAAAFNIKKFKDPLQNMSDETLAALPGIGKSVLSAIKNLLQTGTFPELEQLIAKTPPGVLEMLKVKGLGPKKVGVIWRNMGIETIEDLLDACRENRLVEFPGFGLKTQHEIQQAIQFALNARGWFHYARAEAPATEMLQKLKTQFPSSRTEFTGDFRRNAIVLDAIGILTTLTEIEILEFATTNQLERSADNELKFRDANGFLFAFETTPASDFEKQWFLGTGSAAHFQALGMDESATIQGQTEMEIYQHFGFPYILPERREGIGELQSAGNEALIEFKDLKGILHNHTTYSDGLHSLREMAEHAKKQGYEYLGICDHSRTAGYAQGLSNEKVLKQMEEIDALNAELAPFRIFKGIESDILNDGSLDYEPDLLAKFDLIVASIHSSLNMTEDRAMQRLIKAIENPYTRILGHPTGRLLLVRKGYPVNHRYLIDACAANGVAIELNAHPFRLDLDWTHIPYALEKGVLISINPDAHEKEGYHDMYFGTLAARKGGLTKEMTLNAKTLAEFESWLTLKST